MTRKDTLTVSFHTFLPSEIFGWAGFFDSLHPAGSPGGIFLFCRGAACRSRRYAADPNRLSLKWKWPQICHCEGALRPWQSREGTGDSHRPPLKWYAPIASVAALSERHGQLQIWRHSRRMCNASKFVIARPQRGRGNLGKAVSFSPMAFLRSGYDLRDCTPRALPRASRSGRHVGLRPPRNDKPATLHLHSPPHYVLHFSPHSSFQMFHVKQEFFTERSCTVAIFPCMC